MIIKKGDWKMLITGGKKKKCDNLEGIVKKLSKKKER